MPLSDGPDAKRIKAAWVCRRYEEIRPRLPAARFPAATRQVANLGDLVDEFDVFVLDGYGVLNVGTEAVPGGAKRMTALRAAGKRLVVLTNSATFSSAGNVQRYNRLGYDFTAAEVVSSRDALAHALAARPALLWGFAATANSAIDELAPNALLLGDNPADYAAAEGFVLLSTGEWNRARHELMLAALAERPRLVLVGNPDLVAPRVGGLTLEPGYYAHDIAEHTDVLPEFYGKPFGNAFALVSEKIGADVPPVRIAMVGDTPHTDILGGAATGWRTVLVWRHGLLSGMSTNEIIAHSDIRPDFIAVTT